MQELNIFTSEDLSPKANRALKHLKKEILFGNYTGGDHLSAPRIAETLDISRVPVREAIKELEKMGIVKTIPRKGSFVIDFTDEDINEIYDIRIMLEGKILKILIEERLLTTEDLNQLESYAERMLEIAEAAEMDKQDVIDFMHNDINFHHILWKRSGRRISYEILINNYMQLEIAMISDYALEANFEQTASNHLWIVEKLGERDIEGSRRALIEHIYTHNDKLEEIL